ncbi:MAG: extracellular solute-binding protein [Alphaproteobacteria bacterium]|nr:extracellular solute-binding protein [Alphaproteobacteria bacterium]
MSAFRCFFAIFITLVCVVPSLAYAEGSLTLYSGRGESLVGPLISQFEQETGIKVNVRYADTAALAILISEEGGKSPADIFWAQDAGALGEIAKNGLFDVLPEGIRAPIPEIYKNGSGYWVGTSARTRTLAYSPERAPQNFQPGSIFDLDADLYKNKLGIAPTNGSFQAFLTGMRKLYGDDKTREWLYDLKQHGVKAYANNTALLQAIADGQIDYALVNNYYLPRALQTDPAFPVAQTHFADGDAGNMINVAGVGILKSSKNKEAAERFITFLLSAKAQSYFADTVYEYAVVREAPDDAIQSRAPSVGADDLVNHEATLEMLREVGLL